MDRGIYGYEAYSKQSNGITVELTLQGPTQTHESSVSMFCSPPFTLS